MDDILQRGLELVRHEAIVGARRAVVIRGVAHHVAATRAANHDRSRCDVQNHRHPANEQTLAVDVSRNNLFVNKKHNFKNYISL